MEVTWAWAFLDLAEEGFDEQLAFWQAVTRTTRSSWRGAGDELVALLPADGDPWVTVQRVAGGAGVHLGLDVTGPLPRARDEAVALGAHVVAEHDDVVVARSPGGFVFHLGAGAPGHQQREGQPSLLDQVCLDVPAGRYAAELAFWTALTGWLPPRAEPDASGLLPLTRPDGIPLRLLTQRLGTQRRDTDSPRTRSPHDPEGSVTAHVDLACADRAEEVRVHEALGAVVESVHEGWTVLRAPGGPRYCLTERSPRTGLRG